MLKHGLKYAALEEWQGRACPKISHKKHFLLKILSVMYGLEELNKRSIFCNGT